MLLIKNKLQSIKTNINFLEKKYARSSHTIELLAVSKTKSVELIQQAYDAGQRSFGENYVQEAIEKINYFKSVARLITWHFIGSLQSNKARVVAENFNWVQTIDSIKLAEKLNAFRPDDLDKLNVCIQVNISDESQKSGIKFSELDKLVFEIEKLPRLRLRGLMAIGFANHPKENKKAYENLYKAFQALKLNYDSVDTLSLGMSQDMALAIEHGSTMVRIGRAIFGERKVRESYEK